MEVGGKLATKFVPDVRGAWGEGPPDGEDKRTETGAVGCAEGGVLGELPVDTVLQNGSGGG